MSVQAAGRLTVEDLLREARAVLCRVTALEAHAEMTTGALLIDIRSEHQRERDGTIPGAYFIPRNVFEWRCDPSSRWRDPDVVEPFGRRADRDLRRGLSIELVAAATLVQYSFSDAGDVIGGFQAWSRSGLPVLS